MTVEVRRPESRATTRADGLVSRHSFSFGPHYDPSDVGHAVLVAHNDDRVEAGAGYDTHPHRDLEIVTWVLDGGLRHEDSEGHGGVVVPGLLQRLSAGSGVRHAEHHDVASGPTVRFVQMWVLPDEPGLTPSYAQHDVGPLLAGGDLVPVASGRRGPVRRGGAGAQPGRHVPRRPAGRRAVGRAARRAVPARVPGPRWRRPGGRRPARRGRRRAAHRRRRGAADRRPGRAARCWSGRCTGAADAGRPLRWRGPPTSTPGPAWHRASPRCSPRSSPPCSRRRPCPPVRRSPTRCRSGTPTTWTAGSTWRRCRTATPGTWSSTRSRCRPAGAPGCSSPAR